MDSGKEHIKLVTINQTTYDTSSNSNSPKMSLQRNLTYFKAYSLFVTGMIGSGMFTSPSFVARDTPNMFIAIMVWILAGGCAFMGSLCYSELALLIKKTGSSYIFIFECYGEYAAFVLIWTKALIIIPCINSVISYTAGIYACMPFFEDHTSSSFIWYSKMFAVILFNFTILINCVGVKITGIIQSSFAIMQILIAVVITGLGIYYISVTKDVTNLKPEVIFNNTLSGLRHNVSSLGSAFFSALWCFDGWFMVAQFVEEIVAPTKNIPLVAFTGCTNCYLTIRYYKPCVCDST